MGTPTVALPRSCSSAGLEAAQTRLSRGRDPQGRSSASAAYLLGNGGLPTTLHGQRQGREGAPSATWRALGASAFLVEHEQRRPLEGGVLHRLAQPADGIGRKDLLDGSVASLPQGYEVYDGRGLAYSKGCFAVVRIAPALSTSRA